ncbi:MAG: mechanosensitive ion channel family protein [Oscillospiraceae bacterium]|nr:mechanosensitive ion channel family protein [Oscillospiraceae bacterium]
MELQLNEQLEHGQEALEQTTGLLASFWARIVDYLPTVLIGLVIFLIGLIITRIIDKLIGHALRKAKAGPTATGFGHSLVRVVLYSVLIAIFLSVLGVPIASIVAIIGAAGVTIGLALQNSLSNLAGGFVLLFAKPFQPGDYIIVSDKEGYVEQITIFYTKLLTRDNQKIYLPNSIVSSGAVVNLSQKRSLRVIVPLTIAYGSDLEMVRQALLTTLKMQKIVKPVPEPCIAVSELADSGIKLSIIVWVDNEDYFVAVGPILEAAINALRDIHVEIPYPQLDVHTK